MAPRPSEGEASPQSRSEGSVSSKAQSKAGSKIIPKFDGDSERWKEGMEMYFKAEKIDSGLKVPFAIVHMNGSALKLSKFIHHLNPNISWEDFYYFFNKKYVKNSEISENYFYNESFKISSILNKLSTIEQTGSIDVYIDKFLSLAMDISALNPELYLSLFLKGLKKEVRDGLMLDERRDIMDAIVASQLVYGRLLKEEEEKVSEQLAEVKLKEEESRKLGEHDEAVKKSADAKKKAVMKPAGARVRDKGIKEGPVRREIPPEWILDINLSVDGFPSTVMNVVIGGEIMTVVHSFISCGNVISTEAVRKFKLLTQQTPQFGVQVDGGEVVISHGLVENLKVEFHGKTMNMSFYVCPLPAGVDAVVGSWAKPYMAGSN